MFDVKRFNSDPLSYINSDEYKFLSNFYFDKEFEHPETYASRYIYDSLPDQEDDMALAMNCIIDKKCSKNFSEEKLTAAREYLSQSYISIVNFLTIERPTVVILNSALLYFFREIKVGLIVLYISNNNAHSNILYTSLTFSLSNLGKSNYTKLKSSVKQRLNKEVISEIILFDEVRNKNIKTQAVKVELCLTAYNYEIISKEMLAKHIKLPDFSLHSPEDYIKSTINSNYFKSIAGKDADYSSNFKRNIVAGVKRLYREITTS
jgi:hypothetical protein